MFGIKYPYPEDGYPRETVSKVAETLFDEFSDSFIKDRKTMEFDETAFSGNAIRIMVSMISVSYTHLKNDQ